MGNNNNCCQAEKYEYDLKEESKSNFKENKIINDSPYINNDNLKKIMKIQNNYKMYKSKKKLNNIYIEKKLQIIKELNDESLKDNSKILNCISEKLYQNLIKDKKIIPFEDLNEYKNSINNFKYSFNLPYYIEFSNKLIYMGSWNLNKKFNGFGTLYDFNKEKKTDKKIEGFFINGCLTGYARIFNSNGDYYIGEFLNYILNGHGFEYYKDGSHFEGTYHNGSKIYGKYIWPDNSFYEGNILNEKFNGYGVYKWDDKRRYEGNWLNGKMNGFGKMFYSDGTYYEGGFENNERSGEGKYIWEKNKYYEGRWKNGKQNGEGVYFKKGVKIKGYWINGKIINKKKKNIYGNKNYMNSAEKNYYNIKSNASSVRGDESGKMSVCSNFLNNNMFSESEKEDIIQNNFNKYNNNNNNNNNNEIVNYTSVE